MRVRFQVGSKARLLGAASLLSLALLLSSCGGASAGLGTSSASCFVALPASFHVAGKNAHLLGVKLLPYNIVRRFEKSLGKGAGSHVCVVAFQLPDANSKFSIVKEKDRVLGNFEIVIYTLAQSKVLAIRHPKSLPYKFAHSFSFLI
ncbi:hypothetical protein [Acidithrix sp. C25]|uniref:hypothetical protein n=1 Tax=Acidithrix sp. C25 TaxID=1671482 RepID=UPI00191BA47E|nr:hypothetical protein [Acidithrix sp. C25]CAG4919940.1 unnamed protein product [Acidithrix sp. C25]